jgi:ornithine--oxo-acid transaminase
VIYFLNKAKIIFAEGNFWGRTLAAISSSTDPSSFKGFGPYMPGFGLVPYNDLVALEEALKDKEVAAFMVEPIQGEAGVVIPDDGYLKAVRDLCNKYNVLFIADEIQTGLARTGKMLACDHENVKPDILILGKALSGGTLPISAVLASNEIMMQILPGEHGSTYGGNPVSAVAALATIATIEQDNLIERSKVLEVKFRTRFEALAERCPWIKEVRARGVMIGIQLSVDGAPVVKKCLDNGLLVNCTHQTVIRLLPAMNLTDAEFDAGCAILEDAIAGLAG